jgi:hypothetical protein
VAGNALTAGLSLRIPDVSRATNSASTYRTYQPSEIIGSTTPQGIDPGPPPPPVDDCGAFKQALVIIVAVVVTAVVAMCLPQAAGPVGKALIGAAAAAAGSVASQTVAIAVGLQDDFSWKSVGLAALGGAVGGAINANSKAFELFGGASGVAQAVTSNVLTQGIAVMTGLQEKFSWQSVAVSGASAWINSQIPSGTPGANGTLQPLSAAEKLVRNFLTGTTTQIIRMAVYGQGKLDFASLAADAFGNVIGEAVAEQMRPKVTPPTSAAPKRAAASATPMRSFSQDVAARRAEQDGMFDPLPDNVLAGAGLKFTERAWNKIEGDVNRFIDLAVNPPSAGACNLWPAGSALAGWCTPWPAPPVVVYPNGDKANSEAARWAQLQAAIGRGERVDYSEAIRLGRQFNPSSPWARVPDMGTALADFGLMSGSLTAGMFTGGWAYGAMSARGIGVVRAGAGAGFVGDLTTQGLDNVVSFASSGKYGRRGVNGWELAGATTLGGALPLIGKGFELIGQAKDAVFGGLRFTSRIGEAFDQAIWAQRTTFAGHGSIADATFVVPKGSSITFYSEPGALINNRLGQAIEEGAYLHPLAQAHRRTFGPGELAPNPTLHPIEATWLADSPMGARVLVNEATALKDLMRPGMGSCHWAACMADPTLPAYSYVYTTLGPIKRSGFNVVPR